MSGLTTSSNSLILQANQVINLGTVFQIDTSTGINGFQLTMFDRDNYADTQSHDYGTLSSDGVSVLSGSKTYNFLLSTNGHFYDQNGYELSTFGFKASDQEDRLVNFQVIAYNGAFTPQNIVSRVNVQAVTHSNFTDATPNVASPTEIAQNAQKYCGAVWNKDGCWVLASNIAASSGASLNYNSGWSLADQPDNGQYKVVYNGFNGVQANWQYNLRAGDAVETAWLASGAHIFTVDRVVNGHAYIIDNSGNVGVPGEASTDVVARETDLMTNGYLPKMKQGTVVVFRATGDTAEVAPTVTGTNADTFIAQGAQNAPMTTNVTNLFAAMDANGDPLTYQIKYSGNSGSYMCLNGNAISNGNWVSVDNTTLSNLTLNLGATAATDDLEVRASDGTLTTDSHIAVKMLANPNDAYIFSGGITFGVRTGNGGGILSQVDSCFTLDMKSSVTLGLNYASGSGTITVKDAAGNIVGNGALNSTVGYKNTFALNTGAYFVHYNGALNSFSQDIDVEHTAGKITAQSSVSVNTTGTALSNVCSISDPEGNTNQLRVRDNSSSTGCLFLNGIKQAINQWVPVSYSSFSSFLLKSLGTNIADTVDIQVGNQWAWSDISTINVTTGSTPSISPPTVVINNQQSGYINTTVNVSSMVNITDPQSLTITQVQIVDPTGLGNISLNGATNLSSTSGTYLVSLTDFAKLKYSFSNTTTSDGSENLQISAYNGTSWSNVSSVSVLDKGLRAVNVSANSQQSLYANTLVAVSSLFTATTIESGDTITQYRITDPSGLGNITLNGATNLGSGNMYQFSAADMLKVTYKASNSSTSDQSESLTVSVLDANGVWSAGTSINITDKGIRVPVVTANSAKTVAIGSSVAVSSMFSATTVENADSITQYRVVTGSGHLSLNGATNLGSGSTYQFSAADMAKVTYVGANTSQTSSTDTLTVAALDTYGVWSNNASISVINSGYANHTPIVSASNGSVNAGESLNIGTLISATDQDSGDIITQYKIVDPSGSGTVSSSANISNIAGTVIVTAANLGTLMYKGSASGSSNNETLQVYASDGKEWSAATNFTITNTYVAPVVVVPTPVIITPKPTPTPDPVVKIVATPTPVVLPSPTITPTLTDVQLKKLTATQLANTDISTVSAYQMSQMNNSQLSGLTAGQLSSLNGAQLSVITPTVIKSLSASKVAAFTAAQVSNLTGDQVAAIGANIKNLDPSAISMLGASQLSSLSKAQVGAITSAQSSSLTNGQLAALDASQVSAISTSVINNLTAAQMAGISVSSLTNSQIKAVNVASLSGGQVASLSTGQVAALSNNQIANMSANQVANLTPDQIAKMSAAQLGAMASTITNLDTSGLTANQVKALTTSAFSALSTNQLGTLTTDQVKAITAAQLKTLGQDAIAVLSIDQIGSMAASQITTLSVAQVGYLSNDQVSGLSTSQVNAISTSAMASLSASQVNALTLSQLAGMSTNLVKVLGVTNLTASQLNILATKQVQAITNPQIATLTTDQISNMTSVSSFAVSQLNAMSAAQLNSLNGNQVSSLTVAQVKGFTTTSITSLLPSQIGSMTGAQLVGLSAAQIKAFSPGALGALSASQVGSFTAAQITALTPAQVTTLTQEQIAGLTTAQVNAFSATTVSNFTQAQLNALTTDQIVKMSNTLVKALTPAQIAELTSSQVGALSKAQIGSLSTAQISSMTGEQILALNATQISGLTVGQLNSLNGAQIGVMSNDQVGAMSSAQIKGLTGITNLTPTQFASLTSTQLNALSANTIASLTNDQVTAMTNSQLASLSPTLIKALTPVQMGAMDNLTSLTVKQVQALTVGQLSSLSNDKVAALTNDQLAGMSATQLNSFGAPQLDSLSNGQISALSPSQIKGLSITTVSSLLPSQIGSFTGSQVQALTNGDIANINLTALAPSLFGNLTPAQIKAITAPQLSSITSDQFNSLGTAQMSAFATNTFTNISAAQMNGLSQAEVQAITAPLLKSLSGGIISGLSAGTIDNMKASQIGSLTNAQISSVSGSTLDTLNGDQIKALTGAQLKSFNGSQMASLSHGFYDNLSTSQKKSFGADQVAMLSFH